MPADEGNASSLPRRTSWYAQMFQVIPCEIERRGYNSTRGEKRSITHFHRSRKDVFHMATKQQVKTKNSVKAVSPILTGRIRILESFFLPGYTCAALIELADPPHQLVAVTTTRHQLQTLLETALGSNLLIDCLELKTAKLSTLPDKSWKAQKAYNISAVVVHSKTS